MIKAAKKAPTPKPAAASGKRPAAPGPTSKAAAMNKAPYNPRLTEMSLKSKYGEDAVASHTIPSLSQPNVKMAGQHFERVVGHDPHTMEPIVQRVTFDQRGFPIFDPYTKVEVRISGDLKGMRPDAHMRAATRQLRADIESGKINRGLFSEAEYADIKSGLEKIGDFTWHHHQGTGRMQLVPEDIHEWIRHIGGNKLWGISK
jgi:filamentous hemagglutinin